MTRNRFDLHKSADVKVRKGFKWKFVSRSCKLSSDYMKRFLDFQDLMTNFVNVSEAEN